MPERIAALLRTVRILLGYGRHLADTIEQRAAVPSFSTVASCFGTANLSVIIAHLQRGILRAIALERVLLARAASGRDIEFVQAGARTAKAPAAPADPPAEQSAASPTVRKPAPRPAHRPGWDDSEFHIPTLEELEAQVRRRPLGRTIVDICLDLAVAPGFCTGTFWNELFDIMLSYGGSLVALMREKSRREEAFAEEQDKRPGSDWNWAERSRETIRTVLGFFIGEEPVDPFARSSAPCFPAAAVATGPP